MKTILKKIKIPGLLIFTVIMIAVPGYKSYSVVQSEPGKFPQAQISNGLINVTLYLPDTLNGYYRGSRFDWSGVIPSLQFKGHTYFGKWFEKYDPRTHDAIMGPVNDFSPLGFKDGKQGDPFVKIGIGVLTKLDTMPYSISKPYKLINPGKWKVTKKSDQVEFTHTLVDAGYDYSYTKTVSLEKGKPVMVLTHTIINRGKKTIETNVYNHNFLVIDQQPTGPDFLIEFPFKLAGQFRRGGDKVEFKDNRVVFLKQLAPGETVHGGNIAGFSDNAKDYDIRVENQKTGAGVRITCDKPLSNLVFWAASKTLSCEPYTAIKLAPSEQFSWTITYQFYIREKE
jgi:hypothetical protein